ncbi:hypothetical protein 8014-B2_0054 [Lactobacillus phage ATCC 8014-B2]|uniref:Uncharacterized protein n=1 Tax=Lactobacillus phage ATCC 8014-B2 TaxID=1225795 RepID=K4HZR1_9CAUD|nr:hypothetical protein HOQ89_gp092 [Lactobacillus phage ATCC 8014-B2]AFU63121.1 hypothetical protein 8014-B2_0054 [Lactobacillus phage ATCC 8014-B2]
MKSVLIVIVSVLLTVLLGLMINFIHDKNETYENSVATVVSQKYVPAKNSYAYITGLRTSNEYKYKRIIKLTEISLSDGTMANCEDGDVNGVAYKNENIADKDLMQHLFPDIFDSKFNSKIKLFKVGTEIQTNHEPAHYEISYVSSWTKGKITFNSKKQINYKKVKIGFINKFRVDNRYEKDYYAY